MTPHTPPQRPPGPKPAPGPAHLAVLLTDHPPAASVRLVATEDSGSLLGDSKAWFRPLIGYEGLQSLLGEVILPMEIDGIVASAHSVQRGRRGSKPPERFFILGRSSAEFAEGAQVKVRGLLKAIERAIRAIAGTTDTTAEQWWLAVELARRGHLRRGRIASAAGEDFLDAALNYECLGQAGNLVVWDEYTGRCADNLTKQLTTGKRNPLLTKLSPGIAKELLDLANLSLAEHVVKTLASRHGLETADGLFGQCAVLSGELAPPPLAEADQRVRDAVLTALEEGKVSGRHDLLKLDRSRPHVQAWMFSAGILIEAPDGYLFTDGQLCGWLAELAAAGIEPGQASVREIKDVLGLKRKPAEALRAWLVETSG